MQCPSCGFENVPGNEQCVVCSASLASGHASESVLPPRAKDRSVRQRLSYALRAGETALWLKGGLSRLRPSFNIDLPVWEVEAWHIVISIVPGVGFILITGRWVPGLAQLAAAAVAVAAAYAFWGTPLATAAMSIALGLSMFSVFLVADRRWGTSERGPNAAMRRLGMLAVIAACYAILNYYLAPFYYIFRLLASW